jgi:hypothetical protein
MRLITIGFVSKVPSWLLLKYDPNHTPTTFFEAKTKYSFIR